MTRVVPLALLFGVSVGCGGSSPKPVDKPVEPQPKRVTRVPIEDDSQETSDGQEEGVTFVRTKGSISKETIEAGLAPHSTALAECYTERVGKRRWLGGHVVLQWNLDASGTLASVKLIESNLGSWAIEQCMLDVAWRAEFGKPTGGKVDFTVPLEFSARGGTQIWDEDQALRAIGGQLAALDDCDDFEFEPKPVKPKRGKKAPPKKKPPPPPPEEPPARPEKPPRNVTMTLYVGPGGRLQSVGFASATAEVGPRWAACADKVANSWRLPDPRGQIAKLAIKYRSD